MIKYKIDVLKALKNAGYSSYTIKKEKLLGGSTVAKLKTNDTSLSLNTIDFICNLLNCDISDIVERVKDDTD